MNKIYKVIWSKVKHQYVVVSELAHSNGKQSRTSRNSIRSRIAALVVCGAIAAFGVFSALPNSAFAAGAGAITTSGQYIAVAVDPDSGNDKYWDGRKNRWVYYKVNDTRTFTDAQDKTHTYTFVNVGGKNYWVREGYTITIEEGSRFTAYDQSGDVIAPEDGSFIIDSQKSPDADDAGLISSSEVVLAENEHRQTNSGALVDVSAGIYGGAVNSGGTEVKSRYNYYINDNNSGWKDVGNKENISGMGNYFRQVFRQSDGTYRTATGITVSTDNLYVIDGKLGAFFNSNNSVYTGNVYGLHNEVLMTGVDSVNGNYYSYWGTKINDPNMSMSNMTIGEHDKIVDGLQTNIDHVNGDIVQEIKLDGNKAGQGGTYQDGKGGTINLERRGYWNGTEFVDTGSVDGGITISSEGGTGGKDVAIKFANEDGSFTVDAGSKVEGKTENGGNALTGLSINGEEYTIAAGGKSVTRGSINNDGSVKIYQGNDDTTGIELDGKIHDYALDTGALGNQTVTADNNGQVTLTVKDQYGNGTDKTLTINGLVTEDNLGEQIKAKNNLTVTEGTTSGADGGNWQIEDSKQPGKIFKNTTLVSKEITPPTSGYENTYDISDTDGNTVTLKDVASATKLSSVDSKVGDTQYTSTNYIANGQNLTTAASNLDSAIKGNENKIGALDGRVVNVENDTITGGSIDTDGKINLRQKDGTSITTDNAIHDWKVTDANLDENGTLTLNTENAYGGDTGEVTVNNVASTGYVTNQINANNTIITEQYEDYFNENDKYLNSATFDNQSGKLKLTVAKAGDNGQAKEYEVDLSEYVTENDVYVNEISVDKDQHKLILNRKNATPLELGLEELSDIGVSSTDYQLVENPTNGSGGKYTVDDNGTLTLTVKDLNNPNAATKPITITGLAKKTDVAVVHGKYREGEANNLVDTNAQILDEAMRDEKSSSIALGKDAFVSVQNGKKANALIFGNDTYTGGIAIGENSKALNATVNIGVKDYKGKMGDVDLSDYKTYEAMGVGETSIGSNSYISGSLSTNVGSYNITTTKYMNGGNPLDSIENFGSIIVGTLNSIESNSSSSNIFDTLGGKISGVANNAIGMANKTQNSNGSLIFGTGNEITNSIDSIPSPVEISDIISDKKNDKDVTEIADSFRDAVSDRSKANGGAVLAIGGGNKADYAQNSQLIGVQNEVTGTSKDISEFNMVNGYQNTVTNGSNDTVIGTKNTVTKGDSNVVLGDNHTVKDANNNVILGSSDKETTHTASNTVVIGYNAQANSNNDVAIGSGSVANGAVKTAGYAGANPIGTVSVGSEGNERTITNVAAGRINEDSTDAVNGSQLYATNQKVDAGWTATDGTTNIAVNPTETGTTTLKFAGDRNIDVTADKASSTINVSLKDNVVLGGKASNDPRVQIGGTNGTIMATKNPNSISATTTIDGGNIYVGSSVSVGANDDVVMTDKDITGLSNTTWDGTTDNASRAATEGQLQAVSNEAGKHTTVTVNGGMTAPEDGSYTHDGEGRLDGNLLLKKTDNNGQTEYDLKLNPDLTLQGEDGSTARVEIGGTNGTIMATKDANDMAATTTIDGGNVYVGSSISVGDKVEITDKDITGLSNTSWNGTTDDESRAATEGQLKDVSDTVNAGWTATDSNGASIVVNPENGSTLNFAGDRNIDVKANKDNKSIDVSLSDDVVLGGKEGTSRVEIGGTNGTIMATKDPNSMAATTTIDGGNIYAGNSISVGANDDVVITDKDITGLSNTTWDGTTDDESRAATEGQLQMVSDKVTAGWTATDDAGNKINVNPETRPTLNFASGKNITVSANEDSGEVEVSLNDNINLNDRVYINGDPEEGNNTIVDIKSGNTSKEESIFAVEDKGNGSISIGGIDITNVDGPYLAVGDGKLKFYKDGGLSTGNATGTFSVRPDGDLEISGKNSSFDVDAETGNVNAINSSGSAIMMNDDSVALNAGGNGVVASDEGILLNTNGINEDIKLVTKGTSVSVDSNGTTFTNTNTNETTNINGGTINVGDKLMVEEDGSIYATNNNGSTVMINDNGVALNSEGNGVVVSGEGITLNTNGSAVTVDRFNGTTFTNTNTGETTNINGGTITTNTVKGLSNTTWDDELAKQVANSEELQGTAATQGQLQQAVSAVATEAAKQHTTVSGDDNLTVTSKENTNGGTNYQVTLNDDITLGNPKAGNTEGERSFTINTTDPNGYVPESYKTGSGANFIEENGGFMLFATDTRGFGVFGVTAKGSAWAKDFKTYTTDIYGNNTQYSLNEIGDAVAQMSSYYNEENGKSYTVFSRYLNEAEKDNPFVTVDENATRDIPLALRDDGAVLIGATIKGEDFTDNGIRINGEIDDDGNNVATITGLENTTWTPPAPVATFANEGTETSRAATEAQLNDLYGTVVGYNVDTNGVNYGTVTLGGGRTSYDQDTHEGGTVLNNVAYASGTDGSEAVNVDYLKDAISDAAENGSISTSDQHLVANTETGSNGVYKPNDDGNVNLIVSDEKGNSSTITIGDVASKTELDSLKTNVGDLSYSKVQGDDVKDGDSVTTAIGKLDNKIENISGTATDADNNTVTGGKINSDGTISLTQKDKDSIKLEGQLTDSGVVQEGTSFDKETGTITITSQDKYSGETSSVKVEGIASTEVVGATNKEDLATAYKDADKDGNATTEYITDSESMVEADVALDHAIQDVANTGYANDMVLSNRIDSVEKRLGNVEERIDKVGAMAAAIANLRTMGFDPEAPTEIAIGVGQYKSETGIAIGVFHYPNQDFMLSASLSSSGDELMGGIGATWKLGRKSAAERAKDEEARHLEQAEEMKKLAQQEKVKAQAQRHAKLLAERQQASQKNA